MAGLGVVALFITMLSLGIMGAIAFKGSQNSAGTYTKMFERANMLQMLTVISIIISVTFLGLTHIVEGSSVIAVLSGIAGYVLGGIKNDKADDETDGSKNTEKSKGNATQPTSQNL